MAYFELLDDPLVKNLVNESPNNGTAIAAKTLATTTEYGRVALDEESEVIDDVLHVCVPASHKVNAYI